MVLEVQRLNINWSKQLYEFLSSYEHQGSFKHMMNRVHYLENGLVIACTNDSKIIQVLICEFVNGISETRAIYGEYGDYMIDILDLLCAYCSSSTPVIEKHCFTIESGTYEKFRSLYDRSRLGHYTEMIMVSLPHVETKIRYPV